MTSIGVREARNHFSRVLGQVANGETITVTKRGVPVAKLVPVAPPIRPDLQRRMEEWEEYRQRRNITLGGIPIRDLIEEGRM
ncbi:MAG: type II toxin-antitoxin system Phd/YefM family antitoxin [Thermomicrobiales bacterium]